MWGTRTITHPHLFRRPLKPFICASSDPGSISVSSLPLHEGHLSIRASLTEASIWSRSVGAAGRGGNRFHKPPPPSSALLLSVSGPKDAKPAKHPASVQAVDLQERRAREGKRSGSAGGNEDMLDVLIKMAVAASADNAQEEDQETSSLSRTIAISELCSSTTSSPGSADAETASACTTRGATPLPIPQAGTTSLTVTRPGTPSVPPMLRVLEGASATGEVGVGSKRRLEAVVRGRDSVGDGSNFDGVKHCRTMSMVGQKVGLERRDRGVVERIDPLLGLLMALQQRLSVGQSAVPFTVCAPLM